MAKAVDKRKKNKKLYDGKLKEILTEESDNNVWGAAVLHQPIEEVETADHHTSENPDISTIDVETPRTSNVLIQPEDYSSIHTTPKSISTTQPSDYIVIPIPQQPDNPKPGYSLEPIYFDVSTIANLPKFEIKELIEWTTKRSPKTFQQNIDLNSLSFQIPYETEISKEKFVRSTNLNSTKVFDDLLNNTFVKNTEGNISLSNSDDLNKNLSKLHVFENITETSTLQTDIPYENLTSSTVSSQIDTTPSNEQDITTNQVVETTENIIIENLDNQTESTTVSSTTNIDPEIIKESLFNNNEETTVPTTTNSIKQESKNMSENITDILDDILREIETLRLKHTKTGREL